MASEYSQFRGLIEDSHEKMRSSPFSGFFEYGIDFDTISFETAVPSEIVSSEETLLHEVRQWLIESVDPERIEETGEVPSEYLSALRNLGCFRARIPREYGGLGISQSGFVRLLELIASRSEVLALMVSVQQLGVIQSLSSAGELALSNSEEERKAVERLRSKYLPWLADTALGAFCLTTPEAGSDPSRLQTLARASEDGKSFELSGTLQRGGKLFTTLGTIADCYLMLAVVLYPGEDLETVNRRERITAFLVDRDTPGITTLALQFCGWRGLPNAAIQLDQVRVDARRRLGKVGDGLKIAFKNLATGRINIAGVCLGMMKQLEGIARWWGLRRVQGGKPIGDHALNTRVLVDLAASIYAVESYTRFVAALADTPGTDVRLEAAMLKLFSSEALIQGADNTLQIRGGRGYETFASQTRRGEPAFPVERLYRSARMMRIGEGGSNVLLLYIVRCLLDGMLRDYHSMTPGRLTSIRAGVQFGVRVFAAGLGANRFPEEVRGTGLQCQFAFIERSRRRLLRSILRKIAGEGLYALSRRMGRLFHPGGSMDEVLSPEQSFEQRQVLLGYYAEIAVLLSVMAVTCLRAVRDKEEHAIELAEQFCSAAREKIATYFLRIAFHSHRIENELRNCGKKLMSGEYVHILEQGSVPSDFP